MDGKDTGKSDKEFLLGIFVDELINQCEFSLISWEYLQACLRKIDDCKRIFCHIQAFLVAVANISKILKSLDKFTFSRDELREVLQVPKNSLVNNRDFRNHFEHYDDRLEKWASSSKRKNISDMNISVGGFSAIPKLDSCDCMRNLDISNDFKKILLTFHDNSYDLTKTMHEVKELHERARKLRPYLF